MPPPTVFIHVPRTAGSTFRTVFQTAYGRAAVRNSGNIFRKEGQVAARLRGLAADSGARAVVGHAPYGLYQASGFADARFVTLLRAPVERVLSTYHHLLTRGRSGREMLVTRDGAKLLPLPTADMSPVQMLEEGTYLLENLATRMLSDATSPFGPLTAAHLEQAKRNLSGFAFVGLTEHFDESVVLLQRALELPDPAYDTKGVVRRPADELPPEQLQAIADHNTLDLELYAHACELFDRRREAADPDELAHAVATLRERSAGRGEPRPRGRKRTVDSFDKRLELLARAKAMTPLMVLDLADRGRYVLDPHEHHVTPTLFLKSGRGEMRILDRAVRILRALGLEHDRDGTLVDVGANIGTTTVTALQRGEFARAVGCEPEPRNVRLLRLNVVANDLEERVKVCTVAIGDSDATLRFAVSDRESGMHEVFAGDALDTVIDVPQATLDELGRSGAFAPERVALLWMDAQGHEGHVLRGASELVARGVPVVTELDPAALARHGGLEALLDIAAAHYTHFVPLRHARGRDTIRFDLEPIEALPAEVELLTGLRRFTDILLVRDPRNRPQAGGRPRGAREATAAVVPEATSSSATASGRDRRAFLRDARDELWAVGVELDGATFVVPADPDGPEAPLFVRRAHPDHQLLAAAVATLESLDLADAAREGAFVDLQAGVGLSTIAALRWHGFARAVAVEPDADRFRMLKLAVAVNGLEERVQLHTGTPVIEGTPPLLVRLSPTVEVPPGYTHFVRVAKAKVGTPQPVAALPDRPVPVLLLGLP